MNVQETGARIHEVGKVERPTLSDLAAAERLDQLIGVYTAEIKCCAGGGERQVRFGEEDGAIGEVDGTGDGVVGAS